MVAKPLYPLYKNIIKPLDRVRYPELRYRYEATRALAYKIREYAKDSEIIMMIDQASSPTFFLAECVSSIKNNGRDIEEQGIAMRFYQRLQDLFSELYNDFTDLTIIDKYNNEYL